MNKCIIEIYLLCNTFWSEWSDLFDFPLLKQKALYKCFEDLKSKNPCFLVFTCFFGILAAFSTMQSTNSLEGMFPSSYSVCVRSSSGNISIYREFLIVKFYCEKLTNHSLMHYEWIGRILILLSIILWRRQLLVIVVDRLLVGQH